MAITHYYARQSSKDLRREAESLRRLTTLVLRGLEEADLAQFSRDERGNLVGIAFKRRLLDAIGVADEVKVTLSPGPDEPPWWRRLFQSR